MEDAKISIECFKIIQQGMEHFKRILKKYTTLRFTEDPFYEEGYISMSFVIDNDEYIQMLDECIYQGIYYYAQF